MFLTGVPDADLLILKHLPIRDLLNVCIVNTYANRLCNKESFWLNKFIDTYGKPNMIFNTGHSWKKFYLSILKYENIVNLDINLNTQLKKEKDKILRTDLINFYKRDLVNSVNSNIQNYFEYFKIETLPKRFLVNHERWEKKPFDKPFTDFSLFWTSPGEKSYYGQPDIKYVFVLKKEMKGISLKSSASDLEIYVEKIRKGSIPDYNLEVVTDGFRNLWYDVLEKDILGFQVDFVNLYNEEIIFSNKNLKNLQLLK